MKLKRTSITINERLFADAQPLIGQHYCSNFSEYVAALIKEDVARHSAKVTENPGTYTAKLALPATTKRGKPAA